MKQTKLEENIEVRVARVLLEEEMLEFGKRFGYSKSYISLIESGDRKVPAKVKEFCKETISKLLTPQVEMGEKFSWERPIEEELLSFVEYMIRIWRNTVSSNENYTERRGLAKLFDNNSISRARIEGMICAYETVSKQISKEVSLRQQPNKGDKE